MKKEDVFPSKYLRAADLKGRPWILTIEHAPLETLKNQEGIEQSKTVLHFRDTEKLLPLNITNWDSVAEICGEDTDDWPNGQIEVYPSRTRMGANTVDCIRIRKPSPAKKKSNISEFDELDNETASRPKAILAAAHDDMDDEIPF